MESNTILDVVIEKLVEKFTMRDFVASYAYKLTVYNYELLKVNGESKVVKK